MAYQCNRQGLPKQGPDATGTSILLTARNLGFAYDNLGNRTSASVDGSSHSYTANNLNQYTQTTRYPGLNVTGLAPAAATVTINGANAATRQGEYYAHWIGLGSAGASAWQSVTAASSYGGSLTRSAWLAASPQAYTYDEDGNLLTDERWSRAYDGENRLIAMETLAAAYGAGAPRQRLEFRYDGLGRLIGKKVYSYSGGWVLDLERRFVYDGWQMIAELGVNGPTLTRLRTYARGLDLTGTLHGAGGVGGLLLAKGQFWHADSQQSATATLLPAYDGNGNVMGAIQSADGALAAAYEYDAFGQTQRATGPLARDLVFRFSTKWIDAETGELDYGRRRYSPSLGRFTSRDPIEEKGGLNLYAFVLNNPVSRWDYLGMRYSRAFWKYNSLGLGWDEEGEARPEDADSEMIILEPLVVHGGPSLELLLNVRLIEEVEQKREAPKTSKPEIPNKTDETKKNDCYDFVDRLIAIADSKNGYLNGPDWMQSRQAGRAIGNAFVPRESDVHALVGTPFFNRSAYEPSRTTGAWQNTEGFKNVLIMGRQGRDTYRHIAAGVSLQMNGLGLLVYAGDARDIWQGFNDGRTFGDGGPGGWAQRIAEVAGNHAGMNAGKHLGDYLGEKINSDQLREKLRNELCK